MRARVGARGVRDGQHWGTHWYKAGTLRVTQTAQPHNYPTPRDGKRRFAFEA
eukprot:CAMPEP_0174381106 /NCGR_PEP_ID=MMETSP0811_2-20130205/123797_1 /TAXON_ID=73025 ORGANISM="Eutreptiella gymnastica-like, Strain CCMP1594" /NCGR_SAMPLE_ID=MMETSP0811_2 /ASSEMBLY_ACC=CAM_ASM_000667 /LENGTH=51 /DNA_ID=CAMNT_0015534153 /DNA_START=2934 /DNA_END=3089 /DNA_ORIENTATION=-